MSFQGDVAGLGLGELLQGLSRGGREGILTLRGGGLAARLGVQEGQIHLLPEEDEDAEVWRKRCERAWVKDPDQRIDTLRMSEIAHASRMETMFELLDCTGVHFRFEPGPLPTPGKPTQAAPNAATQQLGVMETGTPADVKLPVTCPPISVEYLLLEYARLMDELAGHPGAESLDDNFVPRALGENAPHKSFTRVWAECDAMSSVREIADRLGWPIRQVRGLLQDLLLRGALRFADEREMLALAQKELQTGRFARAAARLAGWLRTAPPGCPGLGDAQLLLTEWERGKLPAALASMEAADARTLLRRLDLAHGDAGEAIARWNEVRKHHRHDPICELRTLHWQHRSENECDAPSMTDMLRVARKFQEIGHPWRAGIVLRAAASRGPETTSVRLEIGQRMLLVGLTDEGAHWVVEACRALIEAKVPDKSIAPLRQLLALAPSHREAKALLAVAHGRTVTGKRTRRNSIIALASALALSIGAVVKVRRDQDFERRFNEVVEALPQLERAQSLLLESFGEDSSPRIVALRAQIQDGIRSRDAVDRAEWTQRFTECQLECAGGDPVLGLRSALALPPPPACALGSANLPRMSSLLEGLAARLEQTVAEWTEPNDLDTDGVHAEQRLTRLIQDLREVVASAAESKELSEFRERLVTLASTLAARDARRAAERERNLRAEAMKQQDKLLAAARAHTDAGDLARAVDCYDRLAQVAGSEKLIELLTSDIAAVRAHYQAVLDARDLAARGLHREALETLSSVCTNPREHLLPCRIDSLPRAARVRFADGTSRVTPFVLELAPGERLALKLEFEGYEPSQVVIEDPADQLVLLSRLPDAWWKTEARVEALPVSVDEDYIVCDRNGRISRLRTAGDPAWTRELDSIGGVARTPAFLPKRAGSLLVITEEGAAWIVDAADGRLEGPWRTDAAPIAGPDPTSSGVRVVFRDGRELVWSSRLKPESETRLTEDTPVSPSRGHEAGLAVLRHSANQGNRLHSPWGGWECAIGDSEFQVRKDGATETAFAVRRQGDWTFVAWEAPHARLPRGRLWISDGAGLRAFEP